MYKFTYILFFILCIILIFYHVYHTYYFYKSSINKRLRDAILVLYRQTARWSAASLQDDSPLIKVLHANYGAGYLWALKDIVTAEEFRKITGVNLQVFENKIINIHDSATKNLVDKCKDLNFVKDQLILNAMYNRSI